MYLRKHCKSAHSADSVKDLVFFRDMKKSSTHTSREQRNITFSLLADQTTEIVVFHLRKSITFP